MAMSVNYTSRVESGPGLSLSPSFDTYSNGRFEEIAARVVEEFRKSEVDDDDDDVFFCNQEDVNLKNGDFEDDDFEFAFVCREPVSAPISADEIFFDGKIKPIYPIFNTDLLLTDNEDVDDAKGRNRKIDVSAKPPNPTPVRMPLRKFFSEERDPFSSSTSSSEGDDLDGIDSESYCVWKPKPPETLCNKSSSTGTSKRWKFTDLLKRSNSDSKESFMLMNLKRADKSEYIKSDSFKAAEGSKDRRNSGEAKIAGKLITGETVSAHEAHYLRNRAINDEDRRRSYLPYKQDLVGLFANVSGGSRNVHPL